MSAPVGRHSENLKQSRDLSKGRFSRMVKGMELNFTPEQEAQLAQLAIKAGTDPAHLVMNAALLLLADDTRFHAAVREGIMQADRGEFIEEPEMDARFEEMLRS